MINFIMQKINALEIVGHFKKIYPYLKPYKGRALLGFALALPAGAMDAIIAMFLRPFTDTIMIEQSAQDATYIPLLIIGFSFLQSACNYSSAYFNAWVGSKLTQGLQAKVFDKIVYNEPAFFDKMTSGLLLQRCSSDVSTACGGFLAAMKAFAVRLFSSIALVFVLFWNSWQLSIIALVVLGIAFYPLTQIRRKIKNLVKENLLVGAKSSTSLNETFAGNRIISSYNLQEHQSSIFKANLHKGFRIAMKMTQRTGIITPLMHFIISFGIAGVIWLGSYLILNDYLTSGQFVSFIAALLMLYTPLKSIGGTVTGLQQSFMAMDRVTELLERESAIVDKENARELKEVKESIQYKNICFEYIEGKPVLKNINLDIKVGQNIAFVGNSGGGKTSLVNLLPRFYNPSAGSICIDNVHIEDYSLKSLRDNIAIVFQDNFLFTGTIRENIILGNQSATEEEIKLAVEHACLTEFIDSLDLGLETEIGERGILLSGGQKQRVAIARAFIKNAPIVILDEATSALDNRSEAVVQRAINNLMKDRTVFIIAHRLTTVRNADKIIVINYGEAVEMGTHDELIAKPDSQYAVLYNTNLGN